MDKPHDAFVAHRGKRDGLSSYCKPCHVEKSAEWRKANPESRKAQRAKYRAKLQARPIVYLPDRKRCRSCQVTKRGADFTVDKGQPDGLYATCKECRVRWFWNVDRFAIFERDGGFCHLCGGEADRDDFHLDHVLPRAHGGSDDAENLRVSHPDCNMRKGAKVVS